MLGVVVIGGPATPTFQIEKSGAVAQENGGMSEKCGYRFALRLTQVSKLQKIINLNVKFEISPTCHAPYAFTPMFVAFRWTGGGGIWYKGW